jgi:hypothetical protein
MSSFRPLSSEETQKVWTFHKNDLTDDQAKSLHQRGAWGSFLVKAAETKESISLSRLASQFIRDNPYPQAPTGVDW